MRRLSSVPVVAVRGATGSRRPGLRHIQPGAIFLRTTQRVQSRCVQRYTKNYLLWLHKHAQDLSYLFLFFQKVVGSEKSLFTPVYLT